MTEVTPVAIAALGAIPYLAAVPAADRRALAARCAIRRVARGGRVYEEGAPAEGLFVVLAGRVTLVRSSAHGREQVLHAEGPGATLGEVPVFDGGGYVASAVAAEEARLLFVPRAALLDLCRRRPEVALGVIAVLARRVRTFAGLIEDLALRSVTTRVARFLAAEARRQGPEFDLPGTREEIGARLGTVRELISRALSRLHAARVIRLRGRHVRIVDPARLAALAGAD